MCDIVFEKVQDHAGKVNRTSVYAEAASEGFLKKGFMRNFPEFTKKKKNLCRNLFLDKVKLCRSATSLKMNLQSRCFLVKVAKFVEAPFPQDTTGQLLLIVAVSIVVKGELANKAVNYDTKTKAHIWTNLLKRAVHVKEQVSEAVTGRLQIRCS